MKKLVLTFVLLSSVHTFAQSEQPKHIISVGADGFGWSGIATIFDWDKDESNIKDHDASEGKLNLNYAYVFPNRLMIGAFVQSKTEKSTVKTVSGNKITNKESSSEIGLGLGYNFNEDVYNSWWIQGIIAAGSSKEEAKDNSGKDTFDYDYTAVYFKFGKRINLDSWGLRNISYNPTITLASAMVDGDAKDAGLDSITNVQIELIKFDIVF